MAKKLNDRTTLIDSKLSYFLIEAVDASMFQCEIGLLAQERGSTKEICNYGEHIANNQAKLLHQLKVIAACRQIKLPQSLSNEKAEELASLKQKSEEEFDEKLIKIMNNHHKKDVNKFKKAINFNDRYVRIFAQQNIATIQLHLKQIETIRDESQSNTYNTKTISVASN